MGNKSGLSEPSGFVFRLKEGKDVALSDGALDVADDLAGGLSQELHLDLGTLTLWASASENLDNASQRNLFVHFEKWGLCVNLSRRISLKIAKSAKIKIWKLSLDSFKVKEQ